MITGLRLLQFPHGLPKPPQSIYDNVQFTLWNPHVHLIVFKLASRAATVASQGEAGLSGQQRQVGCVPAEGLHSREVSRYSGPFLVVEQ